MLSRDRLIPLLYLHRLHAFFTVDPRGDQPVFPTPSPGYLAVVIPIILTAHLNSFICISVRRQRWRDRKSE